MREDPLGDARLLRTFGTSAVARGKSCAARGRVRDVHVDGGPTGDVVSGRVQGESRWPYDVTVVVRPDRIESWCSCPVSRECQHAVALLWTIRSAASRVPVVVVPEWQRFAESVLAGASTPSTVPETQRALGLRFELPAPRRRQWSAGAEQDLWLRLVREGARGNWIKTGINWYSVVAPRDDLDVDPEQLDAVQRFVRSLGVGIPKETLQLGSVGPAFLDGLTQVQAEGVTLLGGERISSVQVTSEPLEVALDVVQTDSGSQLRSGVWHDDEFHSGPWVHLLGRTPHTVGVLRPVRADTTATHPKVHLLFAPLGQRVPAPLLELHRRHGTIEVPEADRDAFESTFLPRLRHGLTVSSSDHSLTLSDPEPPQLQVLLDWRDLDVEVTWRWRRDDGSTEQFRAGPTGRQAARPGPVREVLAAVEPFQHLQPHLVLSGLATREFLTHDLPRLYALPEVEVVETGAAPEFRDALGEATIEFVADDDSGATDWFDLAVVITVDGEKVPIADVLEALTLERDHVVLPSGLVVTTDRPEFHRLAELTAAAAHIRPDGAMRVASGDLGTWHDLAEIGVVDARAARWVEAARALVGHDSLPEVSPVGLRSTLREYQHTGVRWLAHLWSLGLGGILADDMGLGKTVQTLALVAHARARGAAPFLVVAPTSVLNAWAHEAARHTPNLAVCVVDATRARRGTALADAVADADLVVTSYTLLRLEAEAYADLTWGGLLLDEAQTLKNHQSHTYRAVRDLGVDWVLAVTGTPFENRLMELWALLSVVAPGLYPSAKQFNEQVVRPVEKQGDRAALEAFRARVRPFVLRRTKDLVAADLPAKQEQVLEVVLSARHQKLYDTWLQRERQSILGLVDDFDRNRVAIFSALTRLRQLSLDPALVDSDHEDVGSAKLDLLVEHLVELAAEGHRALVFSQFTGFLMRARSRLEAAGLSCRYLDGSTRNRGREIEAFRSGDGDAFLISLKAGGVGLTLTEADYVFVLDPWWNPAAEAQAVDRAHRIGQQRPVLVYRLVSLGTIEEKVMALKDRKAALFASVFTGDGAVGTGIDAADVRDLFD